MKSYSQTTVVAIVGSLFLSGSFFTSTSVQAQTTSKPINWGAYQDQAVDLMRQYLRFLFNAKLKVVKHALKAVLPN